MTNNAPHGWNEEHLSYTDGKPKAMVDIVNVLLIIIIVAYSFD